MNDKNPIGYETSGDMERAALLEQVKAVMEKNGIALDAAALELLRPLIEGRVDYRRHAMALQRQMKDALDD